MSDVEVGRFGSGQSVRRIEDPALVRGEGQYTDDVNPPGQVFAAFARSSYAHGRLRSVDVDAARERPGVLAVYTGADLVAAGVQPLPTAPNFKRPDGQPMASAPKRALAWVSAAWCMRCNVVKLAVILGAHCSWRWDEPLYKIKALRPLMWVLERTISTPATATTAFAAALTGGAGFLAEIGGPDDIAAKPHPAIKARDHRPFGRGGDAQTVEPRTLDALGGCQRRHDPAVDGRADGRADEAADGRARKAKDGAAEAAANRGADGPENKSCHDENLRCCWSAETGRRRRCAAATSGSGLPRRRQGVRRHG